MEPMVRRALDEDFGNSGDLTAQLLIPAAANAALVMRAREAGIIAGMQAAEMAYAMVDPRVSFSVQTPDGGHVKKGDIVASVQGPTRALVSAERVALNFLGRMSGIATLTAQYVKSVQGTDVRIAATRKTTPWLRAIEKQAVLAGGGYTHRESLAAAIMIKDNHIALAGGIEKAMSTLSKRADHMTRISVEVDTHAQLETLLKYEPDVILLDNMDAENLIKAVAMTKAYAGRRPVLEASGGVNLDTVRGLAQSGVDVISIGALTHSAPNFDIGMDAA
ncbi:MAG: carboxylating nicotinate-nucleotide diphosphorylase [Litorimonas sp.]